MTGSTDDIIRQGDEAFDKGNYAEAADLFVKALDIDPENLYAMLSLSAAYYEGAMYSRALETAQSGLDRFPAESRFAFNAGLACNRLGDDPQAVDFYSRALDIDPHYGLAYYARGNCYFQWAEYGKALQDYRKALDCGGDFSDIQFSLGCCLENTGHYREALEAYEKAHRLGEKTCADRRRGVCHYILEGSRSPEALGLLEEALHVYPQDREAAVYMAAILRDQERYEELERHLASLGAEA